MKWQVETCGKLYVDAHRLLQRHHLGACDQREHVTCRRGSGRRPSPCHEPTQRRQEGLDAACLKQDFSAKSSARRSTPRSSASTTARSKRASTRSSAERSTCTARARSQAVRADGGQHVHLPRSMTRRAAQPLAQEQHVAPTSKLLVIPSEHGRQPQRPSRPPCNAERRSSACRRQGAEGAPRHHLQGGSGAEAHDEAPSTRTAAPTSARRRPT